MMLSSRLFEGHRDLLMFLLVLMLPIPAVADPSGLTELKLMAPHHGRMMQTSIWYPAVAGTATETFAENAVFQGVPVARDAPIATGRHPIVLLSHGLGGHYRSLAWLAAGLAEAGAVVVAVSHPNSTYGDFALRPAFEHWTRVHDLQLALDHVLESNRFSLFLDQNRIYAVGFSYGGWTALSIAGLKGNHAGYSTYCADAGDATSDCADLLRARIDLNDLDATMWDGSHADGRVSRVVAIDPGLTYGLEPRDAAGLSADVTIITLGEPPDRLAATDVGTSGSNFLALLPDANAVEVAPAGHFSALLLCTPDGAAILEDEGDDPVCSDPEGADRATIHARILREAAAHLTLNR